MAGKRKKSGVKSVRRLRESTQERMEKAAKAVFELPPLDDQEEWEAAMLAEIGEGEDDNDADRQ